MMILLLMALTLVGVSAGIIGGLLGISGGVITVPCLVFLFKLYGLPKASLMQMAIGTSLAAMVFNGLSSMKIYHDKHAIHWKLVKSMLPGLVLGCLIGAFVAHLIPERVLRLIFGVFAVLLGIYLYRYRKFPHIIPTYLPGIHTLNSLGFGVGTLSSILGIGGGTITVPLFVKLKIPMKSAVASSTVTGFIVSLAGALSYLLFGLGGNDYNMTMGYIYIPAFIVLAISTFLTAPLGARLAHHLPSRSLKKGFAVCLVLVGILMTIR